MAAAKLPPGWSENHEEALAGLTGMGLKKAHATKLLAAIEGKTELGEMMRMALAMHARSRRMGQVQGGPQRAVPISAPAANEPAPAARPMQPGSPPAPQAGPAWTPVQQAPITQQPTQAQRLRALPASLSPPEPQRQGPLNLDVQQAELARQAAMAALMSGWRGNMPQQPQAAPISPAQVQAQAPAQPLPARMPSARQISPRVYAGTMAFQRPAPIAQPAAAAAPAQAPAEPEQEPGLPRISTDAEYDELRPGQEFLWTPDSHVYTKPEG